MLSEIGTVRIASYTTEQLYSSWQNEVKVLVAEYHTEEEGEAEPGSGTGIDSGSGSGSGSFLCLKLFRKNILKTTTNKPV